MKTLYDGSTGEIKAVVQPNTQCFVADATEQVYEEYDGVFKAQDYYFSGSPMEPTLREEISSCEITLSGSPEVNLEITGIPENSTLIIKPLIGIVGDNIMFDESYGWGINQVVEQTSFTTTLPADGVKYVAIVKKFPYKDTYLIFTN